MTGTQLKNLLSNIGISSTSNFIIPNLNSILMSQNFYVVPERDFFTMDYTNEIIKIKQRNKIKNKDGSYSFIDYSDNDFDIYFDMANVVGLEFLSPKSRY